MSDPPALSDPRSPHSRGVLLFSFHHAARDLFGQEGLRQIAARLPPDVRAASIDEPPLPLAWYPTGHLVAWWEAVSLGPAFGDDKRFDLFVDRSNDLGFGRIRKALLSFVGPEGLVSRAAELWRHDHTTGSVTIAERRATGVRAVLRDHPFTETPIARRAVTEAIRHILSLARGVRRVTSQHLLASDGGLVMNYEWGE